MKPFLNRLTSMWTLGAALLGLVAWGVGKIASQAGSTGLWALFGVLVIVAGGLLMRWPWARKAALTVLLGMVAFKVYGLVHQPFTWGGLLHAAGIVTVAYFLWRQPGRGSAADRTPAQKRHGDSAKNSAIDEFGTDTDTTDDDGQDDEERKPMISLVHLRRQQRYLEAPVLAHALSEAWGLNIVSSGHDEESTEGADGFVVGENPILMVMVHKPAFAMFTVHNHGHNYFDDAEDVAAKVPNLRFAQIIRDHSAWLALDFVQGKSTALDHDDAYRLIGKAVSALADEDTLAILCPQHRFFNLWSSELETTLCGDFPLDALKEEVKAPVIGVPDGDIITAAIAEARRRWPEFVTSFDHRQKEDLFLVKAPFTGDDGETEHMWLEVFALEPEYVHGHLVNEPLHTRRLKQGSQVEVPVTEVSDWVCLDMNRKPIGNFTQQAVSQAAKES